MKRFNRSSLLRSAVLVLALAALLPGRSAMADEWNEVSQKDARISLGAPALGQAIEYHARRKVRYGIAEIGSWRARSGGFPRAEVYAQILQHNARFTSKFDLKDVAEDWNFLKGEELEFGARKTYWNSLGQGKYRSFVFRDQECAVFRQFWGMIAETRGVDAGTRMLTGYYCNPAGHSLSDEAIENVLDSLRVISSGDLTVATNATSQPAGHFDGEWVLEIREPQFMTSGDKVTVNVVDGRFTTNVSADGWSGVVSGRINRFGTLVAHGSLRKPAKPSALLKWSSGPSGDQYIAKVQATALGTSMTFEVSLSRSAKRSDDESAKNL